MAQIQMIQLKSQVSGMSRRTKESSGVDFSGMLKEVGQTSPEKETANAVGEESGKNTEQSKVQESDSEQGQVTDKEETNTEQIPEEGMDSAEESEMNGLTGEAMAQLAGMLISLSQNAQVSEPQVEEIQPEIIEQVGEVLVEEESGPLVMLDVTAEADHKQEAQLLTVEDNDTAADELQIQPPVQGAEQQLEDGVSRQPQEGHLAEESSVRGETRQSSLKDVEVPVHQIMQSNMEISGAVNMQSPSTENVFSVETKNDAALLRTSENTLPTDLSKTIAEKMISRDNMGTLEVTLEPATLGKITIRMMYEDGKAAVSLISDNPKTLEILSQRAGEIAQILEEKTGQTTVVYTPESPYPEQDMNQQKGHEGHPQEQKEHSSKEHAESFAQQLRLGLI